MHPKLKLLDRTQGVPYCTGAKREAMPTYSEDPENLTQLSLVVMIGTQCSYNMSL